MDDTAEQTQVTEESKTEPTAKELVSKGLSGETSKETEAVSEEKPEQQPAGGESEVKPITFASEEEFDKAIKDKVKKVAQGMKDKELKSVYTQIETLKTENAKLKDSYSDKQEDSALTRLEKAETEEYGETAEVKDFQEARREFTGRIRDLRKREREFSEREEKTTTNARQQNAFTKALKLILVKEDADKLFEIVEPLAKKLAEAKTDEEADLLYQVEELKMQMKAEPEKRTKPDSSLPTATGGANLANLHDIAAVRYGLAHSKK